MKKIITLFLCLTFFKSQSQSIFYQAQWLAHIDVVELAKKTENHYAGVDNIPTEYKTEFVRIKDFQDSPFTKPAPDFELINELLIRLKKNDAENFTGAISVLATPISALLGSLSPGLRDTTMKGIGKYIGEEFKRNHTETMMLAYKKTIGKYADVEMLFPKVKSKFETMDWTRFKDYGSEFKEVFKADLDGFLENSFKVIDTDQVTTNGEKYLLDNAIRTKVKDADLYPIVRLVSDVGVKLNDGMSMTEILAFYSTSVNSASVDLPAYFNTSTQKTNGAFIFKSLHTAYYLQAAMRADTSILKNRNWIKISDWQNLDEVKEKQYFLALLRKKISSTIIIPTDDVAGFDALNKKYILPLLLALNQHDEIIRQKDKNIFTGDNFLKYSGVLLKFLTTTLEDASLQTELTKNMKILENALVLTNAIRTGEHINTISNVTSLISSVASVSKNEKFIAFAERIDFYGGFASGIATAKNSEETKNVIKGFANTTGSFTAKQSRANLFVLGITAYPGIFWGTEDDISKTNKYVPDSHRKSVYGITSPLGITLSIPVKENKIIGNIFFQRTELDVASILNIQSGNGDDEVPKGEAIEFTSLLSPGWTFGVTFKNTPLSLAIGINKIRPVRDVGDTSFEDISHTNRFSVKLCYDVTLINLWKPKR